jgi:hypothetical protein
MDWMLVGVLEKQRGWYGESWRIRMKNRWARTVKPGGEIDVLRDLRSDECARTLTPRFEGGILRDLE